MIAFGIFLPILIFAQCFVAQENSLCGNWTAFKDEKCFEIFKNTMSYSEAIVHCHQQDKDSTIAIIKTADEQEAIVKLINSSDVVDNVWIGISKRDGIFRNIDKTDLDFKNWAENRPVLNKTGLDCVEISTDDQNYGKWLNQRCQKQNALVCQKIQPWSTTRLQIMLIDLKREHEKKLRNQNEQIENLQQNPVPIGFIYIQIINQSEPKTIWPNTEWQNISPESAGLFFRVEGGQSFDFGKIQEQQTQSLVIMDTMPVNVESNTLQSGSQHTVGTVFKSLLAGGQDSGHWHFHHFKHNNEEIRPKNSAMKLWKRIK